MQQESNLVVETRGATETRALGARLARWLRGGEVLALIGELGAGKTVFTQGLAHGLGITATVTSPTFVLINRYRSPAGHILQHADCYRLQNALAEMWDAGLADLFLGDDIVVVEWAERVAHLLPAEHLAITFVYLDEDRRRIVFTARGSRYVELLAHLRCGGENSPLPPLERHPTDTSPLTNQPINQPTN